MLGAVGLPLIGVDHHDVNEHAGDLYRLGRQGLPASDALDLDDHQSTATPGGLGHRQHFAIDGLMLHGDVAVLVGGRTAQQGDVDLERLVEQPLAPGQLHNFDEVLGRLALCRPPAWRGSTKVWRPVWVMRPGLPPAISRMSSEMAPCGSV